MDPSRYRLSRSAQAKRIKKFDTYQHNTGTSERITLKSNLKPSQNQSYSKQSIALPGNQITSSLDGIKLNKKLINSVKSSALKSRNQNIDNRNAVVEKTKKPWRKSKNAFPEHRLQKSSIFQRAFYVVGMAVFALATLVSIQTFLTNRQAKEKIGVLGAQSQTYDEQGVAEGTGNDPSESDVSAEAIANYKVSGELPRYFRIPDLGIMARIKHTGVTKSGAVDAPKNIHDVSWYNEGAKPGSPNGSSLLLGHVSGWTGPGVFKKIDKLKVGMRFEVEKGSGQKLKYEVVRSEKLPVDQINMANILSTEVAGEHDLKLMTCSGRYNKDTDQYEERYIVYAKIIR